MKEIGAFFRDNFEAITANPPQEVWEIIKMNKDLQNFNYKKKRNRRIKMGSFSTVLISITIVAFVLYNHPNPKQNPSTAINTSGNQDFDTVGTSSSSKPFFEPSEPILSKSISYNDPLSTCNPLLPTVSEATSTMELELPSSHKTTVLTSSEEQNSEELSRTEKVNIPINNQLVDQPCQVKTDDLQRVENRDEVSSEEILTEPIQDITNLVFFPNAFTPNGDGLNDCFSILPKEQLTNFECYIYNRQGLLVFSSRSLQQNWDGIVKGIPAEQGQYVYLVKFTTKEGKRMQHKGTVLLIR
ncbi:MAG: gliding motility-associated C-terminal domain-containing protein [Bacteroidales bacterium]|jgi:gliding motility-associated-like protein|nr:gliding motility-associated C-terminal domain-containing protein [Bacteroidales bacterium]